MRNTSYDKELNSDKERVTWERDFEKVALSERKKETVGYLREGKKDREITVDLGTRKHQIALKEN